MKVLHVIETYGSGKENYAVGTFQVMKSLINHSTDGAVLINTNLDSSVLGTHCKVYVCNSSPKYVVKNLMNKAVQIYKDESYDIIHVHIGKLSVWRYLSDLVNTNVRVVYTLHSVVNQGRASYNLIPYARRLVGASNITVVAPTEYQKLEFLNYIGFSSSEASNVVTIYNGTNNYGIVPRSYNSRKYDVVFCGRLTMMKNSELCIKFIENNPDLRYLYIGSTDKSNSKAAKEYTSRCYSDITRLSSSDEYTVDYIGTPISNEECLELISDSKALVTLGAETFGLVASEALSVGTPVITSDCGAVPELINDLYNGIIYFVPRTTKDTRAKLLREYYDNFISRVNDKYISELVKLWKNKYSSFTMYDDYHRLYTDIIERK